MLTLRQTAMLRPEYDREAVADCDHPVGTKASNFTQPYVRAIERHCLEYRLVNICLNVWAQHDGDHVSAILISARRIKSKTRRFRTELRVDLLWR
jgi:hypothetical protein